MPMKYDYAVHSDFLIHWTGKDIDNEYDQQWYQSDKSRTNKNNDVTEKYIKRLYDILQFGIWMTSEKDPHLCLNGTSIDLPLTPKSCFTELKLSESRQHARHYGRLGIGFKRPFVIHRFGRPVVYYGFHNYKMKDIFLKQCIQDLTDKNLINFFKSMNSTKTLNYDSYSESEWRIIYFEDLINRRLIKDPRDSKNIKEFAYYQKLTPDEQNKLKYLIPLDGWFTMIIYPSLDVKNEAQRSSNNEIRSEIERIKKDPNNQVYKIEGVNWPIELNLDACRNF
jgi:hypothetical protein